MAKPLPRGPSRWSSGIAQSSSEIAQVSDARRPNFSSGFCTLKPGVLVGTMKAEMPFLPRSGSVTANTIAIAARLPLVMNCLAPRKIHWPFLSTARVLRLFASDPACGSVKQKQPIFFPMARSFRYADFCASVPQAKIGPQPTELCTLMMVEVEASAAAISSIAKA